MSSLINLSYIDQQSMIVVGALFPALSIVFVGLRFYARRKQKVPLLADDWLLVPALIIIIGMGVAFIIGARGHGLGYTRGVPTTASVEVQFNYTSPEDILTQKLVSVLCIGCIKSSVVMFYRRIFVTDMRGWFSIVTIVIMTIIIGWTISFFFVFLFYCRPIEKEWGTIQDILEYCPNALNDDLSVGITDAMVDMMILVIPIPMILKLHLDNTKKIMIMSIFFLGGFAVAASIVRMAIFIQVAVVGFNPSLDGDKDIGLVLFWTMVETGAATVAACLPTLNTLLRNFTFGELLRSIRDTFSLYSASQAQRSGNNSNAASSAERITEQRTTSTTGSYAMHAIQGSDARSNSSMIQDVENYPGKLH